MIDNRKPRRSEIGQRVIDGWVDLPVGNVGWTRVRAASVIEISLIEAATPRQACVQLVSGEKRLIMASMDDVLDMVGWVSEEEK